MKERFKWLGLLLVLVLTMVAWAYYHFALSKEPADRILRYQQEEQHLAEAIGKLYQDPEQVYPKTNVDSKDLDRIGAKVADYSRKIDNSENVLQLAFDTYLKKIQVQPLLNQYFEEDVVTDQGFKEGKLKEIQDLDQAYDLRLNYYFYNPQDAYEEKINEYLDLIKNQVDLRIAAKSELEDLDNLPRTEDYGPIIGKAVKDIVELEASLPEDNFKSEYKQIIDQRFKDLAKDISDWNVESILDLLDQVPRLKKYIEVDFMESDQAQADSIDENINVDNYEEGAQ